MFGKKVMGFSPHSDSDLLTMVLQVNNVQGLQIKKNGTWVPVRPLQGAFVVNLGDCFQARITMLKFGTTNCSQSMEYQSCTNPFVQFIHGPN